MDLDGQGAEVVALDRAAGQGSLDRGQNGF
jgi:hypothetical protein